MKTKKLLCMLIALVILTGALPTTAFAAENASIIRVTTGEGSVPYNSNYQTFNLLLAQNAQAGTENDIKFDYTFDISTADLKRAYENDSENDNYPIGENQELVLYNKSQLTYTKQQPTTLINTIYAQKSNFSPQQDAFEIIIRGTYNVRFDANGGTGVMATVGDIAGEYTLPTCRFMPPVNKEFAGWSLSENGEVLTESEILISADTTLYAIWQNKTTVATKKLAIHSRADWEAAKSKTGQYNYFELYTNLGTNNTENPWVFDGTFPEYTINLKGCNTGDEIFIFKLPSRNTTIKIVNTSSNVGTIYSNSGTNVIVVEAPNGGSHTLVVDNITFDTDDNDYILQAEEDVVCNLIMNNCDITGFGTMFHNFSGYSISNTYGEKRQLNATGSLFGLGWNHDEDRDYEIRNVLGAGHELACKYTAQDEYYVQYKYNYLSDISKVYAFNFRSVLTATDYVDIYMPNASTPTRLDSSSRTITDSDGGSATFLPSEGKLTLNNFDCAAIFVPVGSGATAENQRDIFIELVGENTITGGAKKLSSTIGIFTNNGNIVIGGSGGLTISLEDTQTDSYVSGIDSYVMGRYVTIGDSARVDMSISSKDQSFGIRTCSGNINIDNNASFSAQLSTTETARLAPGMYVRTGNGTGYITIDTTGFVKIDNSNIVPSNSLAYPFYNPTASAGDKYARVYNVGNMELSYKSVSSTTDAWKAHYDFEKTNVSLGATNKHVREVYDIDRGVNTVTVLPKSASDVVHTVKVYKSREIFTEYQYLAGERASLPVPKNHENQSTNLLLGAVVAQGSVPSGFATLDPESNPLTFDVNGDLSIIYMYSGSYFPAPTWTTNTSGGGKIADWGNNNQDNRVVPVDENGIPSFPNFAEHGECLPYSLTNITDISAATIFTKDLLPEGKYRLFFRASTSTVPRYSKVFEVLYDAVTPVISAQPLSKVYAQDEAAQALTVSATTTDEGTLSYQWYVSGSRYFNTETPIVGATLPTYTPDTSTVGKSYYRCKVTNTNNAVGGARRVTATSSVAEIFVEGIAEISFNASGNIEISNPTSKAARLVVVSFDQNGCIVDIKTSNIAKDSQATKNIAELGLVTEGASEIKAMLWGSFMSAKPLAGSIKRNV